MVTVLPVVERGLAWPVRQSVGLVVVPTRCGWRPLGVPVGVAVALGLGLACPDQRRER